MKFVVMATFVSFSHGIIHCSVYIVGDRCDKCVDIISMVVCE